MSELVDIAPRPVVWGLLSTARINELILRGAAGSKALEIRAVASRDRARAERYAREHGLPRWHASYDGLLADPEIEVVYVSLPNALHVEWVERALRSGKHVLCESRSARDRTRSRVCSP
ncbi:MAG TPA: Gfo/Idh/MocA family oxidoreductase [Gaiellaceae bacterium]|nr:Gfo/Idh/MocA family oxidoreductase [Gaiellaceae bacterium]